MFIENVTTIIAGWLFSPRYIPTKLNLDNRRVDPRNCPSLTLYDGTYRHLHATNKKKMQMY